MTMKTTNDTKTIGWLIKISRVLIFTMLFCALIHQGWLSPKAAGAAISTLQGWSNVYTGTAAPGTLTYDIPAGTSGQTRMLVVAVSSVIATNSASQTCTVQYGGQTMTAAASNISTGSSYDRTALFYLQDASLQAATSNQIVVNLSAPSSGVQWTVQVDAAVFEGVDQSVTPLTDSQSWMDGGTTTSTIGPFATALTVGAGDLAVELISITRTGSTTPRTISTWATGWSSSFGPTAQTASGSAAANNCYIAQDTTAGSTTSAQTANRTTNGSMSAMSIKMLPMNLQMGDGTALGTINAGQGTVNNPLDSFTMNASAGGVTVNTLALTGSANFTAANIAGVSVYRDNGTIGVLDGADVLVPSSYSAIAGNATTITFTTPEAVATTTINYLVTVDVAATASTGQTFTGTITTATGDIGTPAFNDTSSATLTIQSPPGLTMGNGTNPASTIAQTTSFNNALDAFTLQTANALGGTASIDTLTVTGSTNFSSANISGVHVYKDNGTTGTFDGADVLMPSSAAAIAGNATTLTFSPPIYVTSTAANYLLVVDIPDGATLLATFTGTVTGATGNGLATPTYGDSGSATLTIKRASSITSCATCHDYPPADATTRNSPAGAVVGSHQKHQYVCSTCHVAPATTTSSDYSHQTGMIQMQATIQGGSYSRGTAFAQANNSTTGTCSTVACHGGNNPTPQWGVGTAQCIDCHSGIVTALTASALSNGVVTQRRNIVAEFASTWSHKRAAGGVATDEDCIVCHMEGDATTKKADPAYHANGYIDLRDPDTGTEIQQATWTNTPAGSGSYTSSGTARDVRFSRNLDSNSLEPFAVSIMINQCLKCHDADGALSANAHVTGGTALKPFNTTVASTSTYYLNNIAAGNAAGSVFDVNDSFDTNNASYHPIRGKQNNSYVTGNRIAAPWDAGKTNGNTTSWGYLMTCWDCHAPVGASGVQTSTVTAHGAPATIRGDYFATTTTNATLCTTCHLGYGTANNHGAGSAFASGGTSQANTQICARCHSSFNAGRPWNGVDAHGYNQWAELRTDTVTAANSVISQGGTGHRPYAFIRTNNLAVENPLTVPAGESRVGNAPGCVRGSSGCSNSHGSFTPGGSY